MLTFNQLCKNLSGRKKKVFKSKTPALGGCPQKKGICLKVFVKAPKKPNSALRKVVKFKLSIKKVIEAYIPGEGHNLQQYSVALMKGGRIPDMPGLKYKLIRGKYDFQAVKNRRTSRSLYGAKKTQI